MLTWHGVTIALGILLGFVVARVWLRESGLNPDPLYALAAVLAVGALVGSRLFYVLEHGGPLLGTYGYTFFGGVILAAVLLVLYVWRSRLSGLYLDAIAAGLPLGVAVGRIGDVIKGEHYGAASESYGRCATACRARATWPGWCSGCSRWAASSSCSSASTARSSRWA